MSKLIEIQLSQDELIFVGVCYLFRLVGTSFDFVYFAIFGGGGVILQEKFEFVS